MDRKYIQSVKTADQFTFLQVDFISGQPPAAGYESPIWDKFRIPVTFPDPPGGGKQRGDKTDIFVRFGDVENEPITSLYFPWPSRSTETEKEEKWAMSKKQIIRRPRA